jgi:hypothetical protein
MSNKLKRWSFWLTGGAFIAAGIVVGTNAESIFFTTLLPVIGFIATTIGLKFIKPEM